MKEERFGQFPRTAVDFSIVVPFFNEVDNIKPLYESIVKVMDGLGHAYEMVFVDDGSRDRSGEILRAIADRGRGGRGRPRARGGVPCAAGRTARSGP